LVAAGVVVVAAGVVMVVAGTSSAGFMPSRASLMSTTVSKGETVPSEVTAALSFFWPAPPAVKMRATATFMSTAAMSPL